MAKKTENKLSYLQMPLPDSRKYYKMTKRSWSGLNCRQTIDTGALSMERNISTLEAPHLVPSQTRERISSIYDHPVSLFGFDDFLLVIYYDDDYYVWIDYITAEGLIYTGCLSVPTEETTEEDCKQPRCVVPFNRHNDVTNPLNAGYTKKLLIFPDKVSMDFEITADGFAIDGIDVDIKEYSNSEEPYLPPDTANHSHYYKNTSESAINADTLYGAAIYRWVDDESDSENSGWKISMPPTAPDIKYATVHLSRVFGVNDDSIYASGYNDYTNWNLDTVDGYNESNAWCSSAQSNTKAGGAFTGITNFQGHVVCFKRDFMHEIYNTKNPFRIQDIYAEGAIDHRTIQDVDGKLIFVSDDDVKIYTGSNPRSIGYYLGVKRFREPVAGTDGRHYYLFCYDENTKRRLFAYDSLVGQWSEQEINVDVLSFAYNKSGMYMLCDDGIVYKMDTGNYSHSWGFETDLITNETVDIKHIKKIQMLADIAKDANIKVYVLYDDEEFDEDNSHLVYTSDGCGRKPIRVKPRQTASYGIKLRVEGCGYVKLYELELFMESGGDLYV